MLNDFYHMLDPVAISAGPITIYWYGLAYVVGALLTAVVMYRTQRRWGFDITVDDLTSVVVGVVFGLIIGARLFYVIFYGDGYYWAHPLEIFATNEGGMSFHGGLLGVLGAFTWFARSRKRPWLQVADFVAPCVPTGLASGRIGNFINGELWGRTADPSLPWAMVFPQSGSMMARHPSQLYQFLLEGLLLFIILWLYARKERKPGQVAALFLLGYGVFRFIAEYFREPDDFLGLLSMGLSMGQWLCIPMILGGMALWVWSDRHFARPGV